MDAVYFPSKIVFASGKIRTFYRFKQEKAIIRIKFGQHHRIRFICYSVTKRDISEAIFLRGLVVMHTK